MKILEAFILSHGPLAVFFIGILEELIFILPSAIVFLAAGFFLIPENIGFSAALAQAFLKIGLPAGAGVAIGSLFIYGLVYWGGKPIFQKYGRYIGLTWDEIERAAARFTSGYYDDLLLFLLRALPIFPISVVSAASGLVRIPWKKFMFYTFLGAFVRAGGAALIGWRVGKEYKLYAAQFELVEKYGLVILIILGAAIYWWLKKRMKHKTLI